MRKSLIVVSIVFAGMALAQEEIGAASEGQEVDPVNAVVKLEVASCSRRIQFIG